MQGQLLRSNGAWRKMTEGEEKMLGWLVRVFSRLPGKRPDLAVLLYHRKGCHLCDIALEQLHAAQQVFAFDLQVKDVDDDPALVADYGECVPVVAINGKVRFRGQVNAVL